MNDDAPREILTAKGDVDAYKLSVFTLGAVKAEQLRLDSIEERLAIVEGHILGGTSGGGLWANPFETLEDFGISFSESVAKFKKYFGWSAYCWYFGKTKRYHFV